MFANPKLNVKLLCVRTYNQMLLSDLTPPLVNQSGLKTISIKCLLWYTITLRV